MKGQEEATLYAAKMSHDQAAQAAAAAANPQGAPTTPTCHTPKLEAPDTQGRSGQKVISSCLGACVPIAGCVS
jgi:hypothetical protein